MNSYFSEQDGSGLRILELNSSYIPLYSVANDGEYDYFTESLPVFSQVNQIINQIENSAQKNFLTLIIDCIKDRVQEEITNGKSFYNVPVIEASIDDEDAVVLVWQFPYFRVFFDIELAVTGSFYGFIGKDENGGSFSKTEIFTEDNYIDCVNSIMDSIVQII